MSLKVIRVVILIAVVMFIFNAWGIFDLPAWYASQAGRTLLGKLVSVAIILVMALGVWVLLASVIEHRLNPETGTGEPSARAKTLLSLFRNALAITFMIVLSEVGINIGPLIAGAGVLGLAIGFGSQKLVQDIITGFFIQVENAMNAGDVVTVGGITGAAERLSIRSVYLRIRIKTKPGIQWAIGQAYKRLVKKHFDAAGIKIPFSAHHPLIRAGQGRHRAPDHLRMLNLRHGKDEGTKAEEYA
jgi:small-conductance mechanosensitive channel